MYLCYLDESGTPELGSQTSHFVLVGIAIPATTWRAKDRRIDLIKSRFGLRDAEIHTGYMARRFPEQEKIPDFEKLDWPARRAAVQQQREQALIRTAALKQPDRLKALKKLYRKSSDYIHLTYAERTEILDEVAKEISLWTDTRLFGAALDKRSQEAATAAEEVFRRAFFLLTSSFRTFLGKIDPAVTGKGFGLLIQDNNETVAKKLTEFARRLHEAESWIPDGNRIVETPLFVDSSLTSMVQLADLCAYAVRRYYENHEHPLFDAIHGRFDFESTAGLSHVTNDAACLCPSCRYQRTQPPIATISQ